MNNDFPEDPVTAKPIIEHLAMWGEVASYEDLLFSSQARWLSILADSGIVEEIKGDDGSTLARALTPKGWILLDTEPNTAVKRALFQVPEYRAYLIGILVEGLALAAKMDMRDQLEFWTGKDLMPLLGEINLGLHVIEAEGGRLIDGSTEEIRNRCITLPGRDEDFSMWDQFLLGRTGRSDELFDFVLKRFAPLATIFKDSEESRPPAVLRHMPLSQENGKASRNGIVPETWNIQRKRIQSSLTFFDFTGKPLRRLEKPQVGQESVQDAFLDHPFYKAVAHLAISAWRSPAAGIPTVELRVGPASRLSHVRVLLGGKDVGALRDLLGPLVSTLGVQPLGLAHGSVQPDLMENLLQNLIAYEVLHLMDDTLRLHPEFQASLVDKRLRTVFRPGKQIQRLMVEELQQILNQGNRGRSNGDRTF
jgi:hypothetical protein